MSTSLAYPHIQTAPGQPARLERIPRMRISHLVAEYISYGWSPEEMCRQHPGLTLSEAHSTMAYYFDHQQEIDAELQAEVEQDEKDRKTHSDPPLILRLRAQGRL
jgi:uncharacterized protein (DUF433 family)